MLNGLSKLKITLDKGIYISPLRKPCKKEIESLKKFLSYKGGWYLEENKKFMELKDV